MINCLITSRDGGSTGARQGLVMLAGLTIVLMGLVARRCGGTRDQRTPVHHRTRTPLLMSFYGAFLGIVAGPVEARLIVVVAGPVESRFVVVVTGPVEARLVVVTVIAKSVEAGLIVIVAGSVEAGFVVIVTSPDGVVLDVAGAVKVRVVAAHLNVQT